MIHFDHATGSAVSRFFLSTGLGAGAGAGMAEKPRQRGKADHWPGCKDTAVRLANWYASRKEAGSGFVGGSFILGPAHRPDLFHGVGREDHSSPRLREEDTENSSARLVAGQATIANVTRIAMGKRNIGTSFDDFLEEEGLLEDATAVAVKRVIAFQLSEAMTAQGLTKTAMAQRMGTSRAALDRLLDPDNSSVTLQTLQSAARALGGRVKIELDFRGVAA